MYPYLSDLFKDLLGITLPFPIYSFGAMMAVAFLLAAWLSRIELDRMYAEGRVGGVKMPVPEGKGRRRSTQEVSPSAIIGTLTVLAVVGGIVGAKAFHIFENLGAFVRDPAGMIFSTGGLTFYGGLIVAALSLAWYVRKKGLAIPPVADALAPGLILAYGVGRIGCHLAGDGDWGIPADVGARPEWLPTWLWAEAYPNAIIGAPASPVYPTSLYEFAMCLALFGILWALRRHPFKAGWLFSLYLIFTGLERFLIEQVRVNNTFDLFGLAVTQAEVISVLMIGIGVLGLVRTSRRDASQQAKGPRSAAPSAVAS